MAPGSPRRPAPAFTRSIRAARPSPISAEAVRADPWGQWHFIPPAVRPYYARTICLHGAESTGKSSLAAALARYYQTDIVPEYGRTWCETFGTDLIMADLLAIARTHDAMTRSALRRCNRRLVLDTDPLMTAVWADMLFGERDPWFEDWQATADLYLLLDIDLPWRDDGTRLFGGTEERRRFHDLAIAELERRGVRWAMVERAGRRALRLRGRGDRSAPALHLRGRCAPSSRLHRHSARKNPLPLWPPCRNRVRGTIDPHGCAALSSPLASLGGAG